jgi:hypothetical protein
MLYPVRYSYGIFAQIIYYFRKIGAAVRLPTRAALTRENSMHRSVRLLTTLVTPALIAASACSLETPLTPASAASTSSAAADGSTLKVGAPTLVSPINDTTVAGRPTLVISPASGQFTSGSFSYEFELQNDSGVAIDRTTTSGTSWAYPNDLQTNAAYRWRARATQAGSVGPWSGTARFQAPRIVTPTVASSNDEWKAWFFNLIQVRGVGPTMTVAALIALDPDLKAASVIQETNSAGQPRGRLYLPTGNPNNLYARSVDLGNFGGAWQWIPVGATVCEGGSCK